METSQLNSYWIQTYTGRQFFPFSPDPDQICIEDIAHALALTCRFGGHCRRFYSVAQHSVIVSELCPAGFELEGLLHDAAEAYVGDLPAPIKCGLSDYRNMERRIERAIAERFSIPWPTREPVKKVDMRMLATEAQQLMGFPPEPWDLCGADPYDLLEISTWDDPKHTFLARFDEIL